MEGNSKDQAKPAAHTGARVEIVGDHERMAEAIKAAIGPAPAISEQLLRNALRPLTRMGGGHERIAEQLRKSLEPVVSMSDQVREELARSSRERQEALKAAMGDLTKIDLPKIDLAAAMRPRIDTSQLVTTRVTPTDLKLPKPVRSIVDVRLEALAEQLEVVATTLNQLIDVAEAQRDATLASHSAAEVRHARSDVLADERAERAHNLAAWSATFAAVAAIVVVIQFFFG